MYVIDFLVKYFATLMEYKFTAHMEEELDQISEGTRKGVDSLREYYTLLEGYLKLAGDSPEVLKGIPIDEKCPQCGGQVVIKYGRFGQFKACAGYPECKFRESMVKQESKPLDEKCPQCGAQLVQKFGKYGAFVACPDYPKCKYIKKENAETGIDCPLACGGKLLRRKTRRGKLFFGCGNYPKCTFATWDEPINRPCPQCGEKILLKKNLIRGDPYIYCRNEKCAFKEAAPREKIWEKPETPEELETPGEPGEPDEQGNL